jgi:cytochrome bd-type quinol oxidase subunit 2
MKILVGINYPIESTFYPNAFILLCFIVIIIFLIMYFLLWLRHTTKKKFPLSIENHFSIATLIVTVVVVFIPFFVQTPLLDYNVYGPLNINNKNIQEIKIVIHNYGIVTANNVIVSLNSDSNETKFLNIISEPFFPFIETRL